jgi:hypothetical protein
MYVVFSTNPSLPSKLIRKYLKKDYSHIAICDYSNDFSSWLITEASHGEVKPVELENWLEKNKVVKLYKWHKTPTKIQLKWLAKQFDKSYSFVALPLIALGFYYGDGDLKHICSELVAKFFGFSNRENVTPSKVEDIINNKIEFSQVHVDELYLKVNDVNDLQ